MKKVPYTTRSGVTQYKVRINESAFRHDSDNGVGWCLACGKVPDTYCEPDARKYECSECHALKVYGLEELLIMGLVTFSGRASAD